MKADLILRNEIVSRFVEKQSHLIGVEVESIVFDKQSRRLPVDNPNTYNSFNLIDDLVAARAPDDQEDIYSLEPGGQIEWASQPARSLNEIQKQFSSHIKRLELILAQKNLYDLDLSLDPLHKPEEVDLVSQKKYSQMDEIFLTTGARGRWMMRNSTSTQINIDYTSIEEAEEMAFLADCIQPITSILFSNAPFVSGIKTGNANSRYQVWLDTDPARCGSLLSHGITRREGLLDRFCDLVLDAPIIFTRNDKDEIGAFKGNAREWIESAPPGTSESTLAKTALHQIFTHVRFKHVIEVRGCDRPPFGYELAPAAFWSGLLIDENTRREALDIVERWSIKDRATLEVSATGLDLEVNGPLGKKISEWINLFSGLALKGLRNRSARIGNNETRYLETFLETYSLKGLSGKYLQDRFSTIEELLKCYEKRKSGETCGW